MKPPAFPIVNMSPEPVDKGSGEVHTTTKQRAGSAKHYRCVGPGIYRSASGRYVERARINGRRTWRTMAALTLAEARIEVAARRSDQRRAKLGLAEDPYGPAHNPTVGSLLNNYVKLGMPFRDGRTRTGSALTEEASRVKRLASWWHNKLLSEVGFRTASEYGRERLRTGKGKKGRTVDIELGTLNNVLRCALQHELIRSNPLGQNRPKFQRKATVDHCRDAMPASADELHALARRLFSHGISEALGWQTLIEALTGLRTCEVLRLRTDGKDGSTPGFIDGDRLHLARAKHGVNPFAIIHPDLAACIRGLQRWLKLRFPDSPWLIPGKLDKGILPAKSGSLTHALQRAAKELGLPRRTSHGLRAFYVTVRRSQGIPDGQIAVEIGDKSGATIIESTYGSIPPNWQGRKPLSWTPSTGKPAWTFAFE